MQRPSVATGSDLLLRLPGRRLGVLGKQGDEGVQPAVGLLDTPRWASTSSTGESSRVRTLSAASAMEEKQRSVACIGYRWPASPAPASKVIAGSTPSRSKTSSRALAAAEVSESEAAVSPASGRLSQGPQAAPSL